MPSPSPSLRRWRLADRDPRRSGHLPAKRRHEGRWRLCIHRDRSFVCIASVASRAASVDETLPDIVDITADGNARYILDTNIEITEAGPIGIRTFAGHAQAATGNNIAVAGEAQVAAGEIRCPTTGKISCPRAEAPATAGEVEVQGPAERKFT